MGDERKTGEPAGPDTGDGRGERDTESLEARRQRLDAELAARRMPDAPETERSRDARGFAMAIKLSSEFIAGVVVGAIIGYLFDRFTGSQPWGMIIFLILGFCAGVLNLLRSTGTVTIPEAGGEPDGRQDAKDSRTDGK